MEPSVEMNFPALVNSFADLPESPAYSWINENYAILESKLDEVAALLTQTVDDTRFNAAINEIHFIIDKVPLMMNRLQPGFPIFRGRANYGTLFSEQQEISYNVAHASKISAGRFNRPLEPLFYGALRVPNPKSDPVLQCCLESCKALTDHLEAPSIQDITIGCWTNKGLLPVINLCFDERHLAGNPELLEATNTFKADVNRYYSTGACAFIDRFMTFFSRLAWSVNENENSYYILNAFFYAVKYYYANTLNTAIPGIIYPSAMMAGDGLSVVLVPQAVDLFLELKHVYMQRFILVKETEKFVSYPSSRLAKVINGKFDLQDVKPFAIKGKVFHYPPVSI